MTKLNKSILTINSIINSPIYIKDSDYKLSLQMFIDQNIGTKPTLYCHSHDCLFAASESLPLIKFSSPYGLSHYEPNGPSLFFDTVVSQILNATSCPDIYRDDVELYLRKKLKILFNSRVVQTYKVLNKE